jgi:hypothetical protein
MFFFFFNFEMSEFYIRHRNSNFSAGNTVFQADFIGSKFKLKIYAYPYFHYNPLRNSPFWEILTNNCSILLSKTEQTLQFLFVGFFLIYLVTKKCRNVWLLPESLSVTPTSWVHA